LMSEGALRSFFFFSISPPHGNSHCIVTRVRAEIACST
jgi:hypothetical protein